MKNSIKISLLFYVIFILGIMGIATLVNKTLNKKSQIEVSFPPMNIKADVHTYKL